MLPYPSSFRNFPGWLSYPGKTLARFLFPMLERNGFAEHLGEVRGKREVAAFVELRLIKSGPAAMQEGFAK